MVINMENRYATACIFDLQRGSYVDGPGIRTTVFFKGCDLACAWCHNPESQCAKIERLWYESKCRYCQKCVKVCKSCALSFDADSKKILIDSEKCTLCGSCAMLCPANAISICGRVEGIDDIMCEIKKDRAFYEVSGGGVTFSGGECMLQLEPLSELLRLCRSENIHTAVDTAGCVGWSSFEAVMPHTELFLYDIKCISPELHKKYIGTDNRLILENYKRLIECKCRVFVRIPMIPEVNANDEEFERICEFLHEYRPEKVELLLYHALGENKYRALGKGEPMSFSVPGKELIERYSSMLSDINGK